MGIFYFLWVVGFFFEGKGLINCFNNSMLASACRLKVRGGLQVVLVACCCVSDGGMGGLFVFFIGLFLLCVVLVEGWG